MAQTGQTRASAIHDARRAEAYLLLTDGDAVIQPPAVLPFVDAVARVKAFGPCVLAGTGADQAHQTLGDGFVLSHIRQPDALWLARLAQMRPVPKGVPGPLYLRAPDAKLPGGKALV
jgi:tRNA threonylcarbamoyladenosine biosynthesis protein TsaB